LGCVDDGGLNQFLWLEAQNLKTTLHSAAVTACIPTAAMQLVFVLLDIEWLGGNGV
jgi:hypothetical protein